MGFKLSFATALVVFATILYTSYAADVTCITDSCVSNDNITTCVTNNNPAECKDSVCIDLEGKALIIALKKTLTFTLRDCVSNKTSCESIKNHTQSMETWGLKDIDATSCRTCEGDNCNNNGAHALHTTMAVFMVPIIVLISKSIL